MAEQPEQFLTVAEVAGLLKLNPQTIRNWIDAGTLAAVRIGRRVRVKKSDLDRLLEAGYQPGNATSVSFAGPSAQDFWSGEPVGAAELLTADGPAAGAAAGAVAEERDEAEADLDTEALPTPVEL